MKRNSGLASLESNKFSLEHREIELRTLIENLVEKPKQEKAKQMNLGEKLDAIQKYLRNLNGGSKDAESSREAHFAKRIINVELLDIKVVPVDVGFDSSV